MRSSVACEPPCYTAFSSACTFAACAHYCRGISRVFSPCTAGGTAVLPPSLQRCLSACNVCICNARSVNPFSCTLILLQHTVVIPLLHPLLAALQGFPVSSEGELQQRNRAKKQRPCIRDSGLVQICLQVVWRVGEGLLSIESVTHCPQSVTH